MNDNDRFDEVMRDAARAYNAPPETPREEMWAALRKGLDEQAVSDAGSAEQASVQSDITPIRRGGNRWTRWAVGIAAALLAGFALGRWQGSARSGEIVLADQPVTGAPQRTAHEPLGDARRAPSSAYQIAAIQHLTRMEVLLTSFRSEAGKGRAADDQLSVLAADLLGTTRLLLDSPAADDQRLKRLLQDLELVLAQIAQLGLLREGEEVQMINEAVEWRNVLPRLRSAIPAGSTPAGI